MRSTKITGATKSLAKHLFLLSHVFQHPLQCLQSLCFNLSHHRMHKIDATHVYDLEEFVCHQEERREEFEKVLWNIYYIQTESMCCALSMPGAAQE